MKVCVLAPAFDAFKGGNHLPLLRALPGVDVTILTGKVKPDSPDLPPNVRIERLPPYRSGPYYFGMADRAYAKAVLVAYPPDHDFWKGFDVIHLNQTMGPALLRLRETGKPILSLIHHPVSVDAALAIAESSGLGRIAWWLRYALLRRWQGRLCRELPLTVTVSETSAQRIADDYGCPREKIVVVQNGVDGGVFAPADPATTEFDAIAVGSLMHPRKGFRYLLEAYRVLGTRGYRIADVGRRSDAQRRLLSEIPNLRAFGTVEEGELLSLMRRSAVLLSASLYEGFGLSLIEALACGRPAFAFDAGATGEVLRPIDPGLLVPIRDGAALADKAIEFLALPEEERREKGKRYREAVLALYPLSRSAEALGSLYGAIVAGSL